MDGLFHWLMTARSLRTLAEVQRMAKWSSASVVGPVLPARLGRLTPMAPAVDGRGELARAFTSTLRYTGDRTLAVEERPVPVPSASEIVIAVEY